MDQAPRLWFITLGLAITSSASAAVTFDWAVVGNARNAGELSGAGTGAFGPDKVVGAVPYNYAISKTEVTNAQYTEFLNAVDPTGANLLGLFNDTGFLGGMPGNFGGIEKTGTVDGARYIAQPGRDLNPVTFVSFFDAMRFTNWLHNGQGSGDTETGAYTIGNGVTEVRSANARYWIPSEDEWYKAGYHDASAGTDGVYFDYATGSDSPPVSDQPGDNPSAVNYYNDDGVANGFNDGHAVSGSISFPTSTNPFTDVGAYTAAVSPYGTFDQSGNVGEWNEAVIESAVFNATFRGLRGGAWGDDPIGLRAGGRFSLLPSSEGRGVGFRIATVPEPSTLALAAIGAVVAGRRRGCLWCRK
ncbi:MAG: SUMF1/EgtB/PvdO family nonheme iron enzyme [Planctomycetota bacterium]